jgi:non-specific serine/threonine protein kinase
MSDRYLFDRFEVRCAERRLLVDGKPVVLGARAFDVLQALIEGRGRVVPKERLFERVWPGLVVEENNLQVQVSALRKLLGPHAIATVPGRGYSFTAALVDGGAEVPQRTELPTNNLPLRLSSFIGREQALVETEGLIERTRLLTLVGAGGIGKTRLALQLAASLLGRFPDGVWFVELAPLHDGRLIAQEVALALDVEERNRQTLQRALAAHLRERHLLIVLDNCEHLVAACAELVGFLLQAGPHVRILATSREPLHLAGETSYQVPALSLPDTQRHDAQGGLLTCEAVRLFAERAAAVNREFQVTRENAPAIADICRRLDGVPLALELAAARVRALPVETISRRLSDRFQLLTNGDKTSLPRHQTLRACIDWSHEQLAESERAVLRRLAVFAGSWTLEAAEAVGAAGDVAPSDVLDLLTRLVHKSLVETVGGGLRYRMLETVRQYADEQLTRSGEGDEARRRHLDFFLALAGEIEPKLYGPEQQAWLARLDAEQENIFTAMETCWRIEEGGRTALTLVHLVERWIIVRGLVEMGHRVTTTALMREDAQARDVMRCRALWMASEFDYFLGRYAIARASVQESLAIAREIGDQVRIAEALRLLGYLLRADGDAEQARPHFREALRIARALGDKRGLPRALNGLAELHRGEGEFDAAIPYYEEALALDRTLGDRRGIAVQLGNLAKLHVALGHREQARAILRESLEIADEIGSPQARQNALEGCVGLASLLGEWEVAARLDGATEAQTSRSGFFREPADARFLAAFVALAGDALGARALEAAQAAGRALDAESVVAEARALLA